MFYIPQPKMLEIVVFLNAHGENTKTHIIYKIIQKLEDAGLKLGD